VLEHKKPGKFITGMKASTTVFNITRMIDPVALAQKFKEEGLTLDMKIAQVAPLYETVPPKHYEGTEYVLSVMLQSVFQRAGKQRFTATRLAHDFVQQFESLVARNQDVSEAA
jgi:hypothetical protein